MVDGQESGTEESAVSEEGIEEISEETSEESEGTEEKEEEEEEVVAPSKMYTVKVNGEETQVTEEQLLAAYQTRQASDETFRQASDLRKQNESLIQMLKDEGLLDEVEEIKPDEFFGKVVVPK